MFVGGSWRNCKKELYSNGQIADQNMNSGIKWLESHTLRSIESRQGGHLLSCHALLADIREGTIGGVDELIHVMYSQIIHVWGLDYEWNGISLKIQRFTWKRTTTK